ncbi:carbamoyl phosphate synthase preATP-grasp domain-containing protein [Cupriavidus basilensis]
MPKRTDIKSILIIGAGPIIIGQACEFDYSGAQAVQGAARGRLQGHPGQLQSGHDHDRSQHGRCDLHRADYLGSGRAASLRKSVPTRSLPTMGGQTALNCALDLHRHGVLDKYKVELIGASPEAIDKAEDRQKFKEAMTKIGLEFGQVRHRPLDGRSAGRADARSPRKPRPAATRS